MRYGEGKVGERLHFVACLIVAIAGVGVLGRRRELLDADGDGVERMTLARFRSRRCGHPAFSTTFACPLYTPFSLLKSG